MFMGSHTLLGFYTFAAIGMSLFSLVLLMPFDCYFDAACANLTDLMYVADTTDGYVYACSYAKNLQNYLPQTTQ